MNVLLSTFCYLLIKDQLNRRIEMHTTKPNNLAYSPLSASNYKCAVYLSSFNQRVVYIRFLYSRFCMGLFGGVSACEIFRC